MAPTHKLRQVLEIFRDFNPETPAQWMVAFMLIAEAHDRGEYLRPMQLEKLLGVSSSSASSIAQALSYQSWTGKPGLDVVRIDPDMRDARARVLVLNGKGQRAWHRIKEIMED